MSDAMIWLILGLLALVVIGLIVYPLITKTGQEGSNRFTLAKDCDSDEIENFLDKCPCIKAESRETEITGCPSGTNPTPFTSEQRTKCNQEGIC